MFNIFLVVFFSTLAFAFADPFFFIGYLISIAIFGLFQAIFMANAGGAWDNAKKVVEVELKAKGTALHDACVVGDTVGDPFKDTSSVAMNPVIKFTTLFGLLAVELAIKMELGAAHRRSRAVFLAVALVFVYRSFYGMRIEAGVKAAAGAAAAQPAAHSHGASSSLRRIPRAALAQGAAPPSRCSLSTAWPSSPGRPRRFTSSSRATRRSCRTRSRATGIVAVPALFAKADAQQLRPPLEPICGAGLIEAEERVRRRPLRHRRARHRARAAPRGAAGRPDPYREFRAEILEDVLARAAAPRALAAQLEALRQLVYELSTRLPTESGAPAARRGGRADERRRPRSSTSSPPRRSPDPESAAEGPRGARRRPPPRARARGGRRGRARAVEGEEPAGVARLGSAAHASPTP